MRVSMLLAAVGLVSASAAFANPAVSTKPANAAAAKPIAEQVCAACHGVDGVPAWQRPTLSWLANTQSICISS